jgi:hypothetical protein
MIRIKDIAKNLLQNKTCFMCRHYRLTDGGMRKYCSLYNNFERIKYNTCKEAEFPRNIF